MAVMGIHDGHGLVVHGRDVAALGFSAIATASFAELGAIAGFFIAPHIAGSKDGKTFNKYIPLLMLTERLLSRFGGGWTL
jgi:hypothetical protein